MKLMKTKRFKLLAGGILAASSLLLLAPAQADDDVPMAGTLDTNPSAPKSPTSQVLTYGTAYDGPDWANRTKQVMDLNKKLLRITNNTGQTVYPIIRSYNDTLVVDAKGNAILPKISVYNPFDPAQQEYRGYIGYEKDGKYYYGLQKGQTILVSLPPVFWNAARMGIETGGEYLKHNQDKLPNPLRNDARATTSITKSEKETDSRANPDAKAIDNGVILWYRSNDPVWGVAPADDTQDQLVEWTIRDHAFLTNETVQKKTSVGNGKTQIPDTQMLDLINYDVSNVDSLFLPVSMEATDSWIMPQMKGDSTGHGWIAGSHPAPFGWTGSTKDSAFLQPLIRKFVADDGDPDGSLLGKYFTDNGKGKGWPFYNFWGIDPKKDMVKIPSGANIFPQSPLLNGTRSSYADGKDWTKERYMLSSGGTGPVAVNIGAAAEQDKSNTSILVLAPDAPEEKLKFIKPGMLVIGNPPPKQTNPIKPGTTVKSVNGNKVTLNQPKAAAAANCNFTFSNAGHDYAVDALVRLWFSWAEYYRKNWMTEHPNASTSTKTATATIAKDTATMVLKDTDTEKLGLVEGMSVEGKGLIYKEIKTENGYQQGPIIILEIAPDKKTLILSQVATADSPANGGTYTFNPPPALIWTPKAGQPGYPLFVDQLVFDASTVENCHKPYEFAQQVYLIMAAMNQIGEPNNNTVNKFMQDIIGANMGYIFDKSKHPLPEVQMVMAVIRDKIKSVLRGVSDFTKYPDTDNKTWYPNPAVKARGHNGKLDFNVFNLDPFVWFVHRVLGFSGYGFSVDDDTADIGAGGATQLHVLVTGSKGLQQPAEWSIQAPFGPFEFECDYYSGPDSANGVAYQMDITDASNTSPIRITTSQLLLHKLKEGDPVIIQAVNGNENANSKINPKTKKLIPFKAKNIGKNTFDLFNSDDDTPTKGSGAYDTKTPGWWANYPYHPYIDTSSQQWDVFQKVTSDDPSGVFQGTWVSVDGVDRNAKGERFRVWQRGDASKGRLILNTALTDSSGNPVPEKHKIKVRFFGLDPKP